MYVIYGSVCEVASVCQEQIEDSVWNLNTNFHMFKTHLSFFFVLGTSQKLRDFLEVEIHYSCDLVLHCDTCLKLMRFCSTKSDLNFVLMTIIKAEIVSCISNNIC